MTFGKTAASTRVHRRGRHRRRPVSPATRWPTSRACNAALSHLQAAENELQAADNDKGGHRKNALDLTQRAIAQVRKGMSYDRTQLSRGHSAPVGEAGGLRRTWAMIGSMTPLDLPDAALAAYLEHAHPGFSRSAGRDQVQGRAIQPHLPDRCRQRELCAAAQAARQLLASAHAVDREFRVLTGPARRRGAGGASRCTCAATSRSSARCSI